ncbi:beta-lactamase domain protein [Rippkaea orientalis PCC 8801]|uniref:Beta-lactamase domain protein n=1 Tax=Rippkaea orientalis (strain PCC 8801 / RF-1) TaxID=41431 RepID=B7K1M6_RIPO1|nr:diflavin flavoprotein [Rippkaea orientalis]ACK67568.1 beta-lactamase domain protein [Rippkaea orientalis PCC 8801]
MLTSTRPRDVQIANIGTNTTIFRSRTWDRLKFEVEYALSKGTTANSYLIQGGKIALLDPPGESFTSIFLEQLANHLDFSQLDYVILGHVNPNRMATLKVLVEKAPQIKLICSKPGAKALKATFPQWEARIEAVRSEEILDLGQGHQLKFAFVPTPRWPDGLCTYDCKTRILYTDKLFGVHLCNDALFDEDWKQLDEDRRYYFDCLYGAQAKQVEAILDKLEAFSAKYYAPGHGVIVRYSLSRFTYDYRQWVQRQKSQELKVALLYASAYGNTTIIAQAIAQGLIDSGLAVELINCELATPEEITQAIADCDGFIIGSPTLGGHTPVQMQTALGIVLATASKTKLAGVFGSFGWSGEAIDLIEGKLRDGNYRLGFETIRIRFSPDQTALQQCQQAGINFAQTLKKRQKPEIAPQGLTQTQSDRTEQAIGRIIGSLCVITTYHGDTHRGFLTSSISQATFNPPGIMIAIEKRQWNEAFFDLQASFVVNILQEGRNIRKHFSEGIGSPFAQLETQTASNGCLVLTQGLAYLECTVAQQIDAGDRWLVYAVVNHGDVLQATGLTAIAHRKSGRHL